MDESTLISYLMDYLFILIFCLLGGIVKDAYNTLTEKDTKVKISRILVSTLVSSVILFSLSDIILSKCSYKIFILPCFIGGILGFEIMGKINNLGFWLKLYKNKDKFLKELADDIDKVSKDEKEE